MGNEEYIIMENDRYHHPELIALGNKDGLNLKSEIEEVQTGIGRSQEYIEPSLEQFIESNDFFNHNVYEVDNGTDLELLKCLPSNSHIKQDVDFELKIESDRFQEYNEVSQEQYIELHKNNNQNINQADGGSDLVPAIWPPIYFNIENELDFSVKKEEKFEIETYSYQGEEFNETLQKKMKELVDFNTRQIMKNGDETKSVPADYAQVDEVNFKVEIEENAEIKIDNYQDESEETLKNQFMVAEENINDRNIQRIRETGKKFKRVVKNPRKKTFNLKTRQRSMNSFDNFGHETTNEKISTFACSICGKEISEAGKLKRHMLLHLKDPENTRDLICVEDCDKLGLEKKINNIFQEHKNSIDLNERSVKCEFCESEANQKSDPDKKVSCVHLKKRKFECNLCEYKTNRKSDLDKHVSCVHLRERKFECHLCEYKATRKSYLAIHLSSVHLKERNFQCHLCEYKGNLKWQLDRHMSTVHLKEFKFECQLCEYKANQKTQVDIHFKSVHLNERKFECNNCEYKASRKADLAKHISRVHLKERHFECNLCEYKAKEKFGLDRHMNSVHLKEPFKCKLCEYKTNQKTQLEKHFKLVHLNERKFECNLCEYKTNRKADFAKHVSCVHLKERKFECQLCEYKCNSKWQLDRHVSSVHLKERNFECRFCEYKANDKTQLEIHFKSVHLNERKFKCNLCEYKANQKSHLSSHMRSAHLKEPKFESVMLT